MTLSAVVLCVRQYVLFLRNCWKCRVFEVAAWILFSSWLASFKSTKGKNTIFLNDIALNVRGWRNNMSWVLVSSHFCLCIYLFFLLNGYFFFQFLCTKDELPFEQGRLQDQISNFFFCEESSSKSSCFAQFGSLAPALICDFRIDGLLCPHSLLQTGELMCQPEGRKCVYD